MIENRLLVMDDDPDVAAFFGQVAEDLGFAVHLLNEPAEFLRVVGEASPSVIVLDLQMPGRDGIELLRELAAASCQAKIVIGTGLDNRVLATAAELGLAMGLDVAGSFCKPIAAEDLKALLGKLKVASVVVTAEQLRHAIADGRMVVHYLPKATLKAPGRWVIDGAEALVRWDHPQHGLLYPGDFLHLAEESDSLIVELNDFVFRTAMEQTRIWLEKGLHMEMSLNLATHFLADLEFPDRLLAVIADHGLDPSMITLELKETTAAKNPEVTLDVLARLRVKNVNLCLDDFGTGFSSLTHLYRMPFSEVKLDNAFVQDMRSRSDASAFVEGLVYLAHKLKLRVCAEGVEDRATLEMLEAMRCDKAQGHYIGPAMRARDLERASEAWNGVAAA